MNYHRKYPVRMNVRMTEIQRDALQKKAMQLGMSSSALLRVLINQLEPFKKLDV